MDSCPIIIVVRSLNNPVFCMRIFWIKWMRFDPITCQYYMAIFKVKAYPTIWFVFCTKVFLLVIVQNNIFWRAFFTIISINRRRFDFNFFFNVIICLINEISKDSCISLIINFAFNIFFKPFLQLAPNPFSQVFFIKCLQKIMDLFGSHIFK